MAIESAGHVARKRLGSALIVGGAGLLFVFFMARASSESSSAAGVEAFQQARSPQQAPQAKRSTTVVAEPVSSVGTPEPDFSLWSEKRIDEYRAAQAASADIPLAVLSIDRLGLKVPVYDGATDFNLNRGVARIKGTARLGEPGNLGIAGHRDGFFRGLQDIAIGDGLVVQTLQGEEAYRVHSIEIVDPDEVRVLAPTEDDTVTLVTCYPFYFVGSAPQRFIVTAKAVPVQVQT